MNRFRTAFASLLLVAVATSFLAGWGVANNSGLAAMSAGQAATTTSGVATSTSETTSIVAAVSGSSTESTSTQAGTTATTTTNTISTTTVATTSTSAAAGMTVTVAGTTTTVTSTSAAAAVYGPFSMSFALSSTQAESTLRAAQSLSLLLAPVCWIVLGGMWVWRGRVRARYSELGFGSDVFELFMKMKGGATRIKVLSTLSTPKDRLQVAEELGIDWKAIDRHVQILNKYGFVSEQAAYGTVRLYQVTPMGKMLLDLFDDLESTDGQGARPTTLAGSRDERLTGP